MNLYRRLALLFALLLLLIVAAANLGLGPALFGFIMFSLVDLAAGYAGIFLFGESGAHVKRVIFGRGVKLLQSGREVHPALLRNDRRKEL